MAGGPRYLVPDTNARSGQAYGGDQLRELVAAGRIAPDVLVHVVGSGQTMRAGDVPPDPPPPPHPEDKPAYWYRARIGQEVGPFAAGTIRALIAEGTIGYANQVRHEGADWMPIHSYQEFLDALGSRPRAAGTSSAVVGAGAPPAGRPSAGTQLTRTSYAPGQRPSAPGLFVTFAHPPADVAAFLDRLAAQCSAADRARRWTRWPLVFALLAVGIAAPIVDQQLGYDAGVFLPLLPLSLILAVWVMVATRASGSSAARDPLRDPRLADCRALLAALDGDLAPGAAVTGWLDLTGPEQPSKVVRQGRSVGGAEIKVYRDEWCRLKVPLRDGNQLRLSAVERRKVRSAVRKRRRTKPARMEAIHTVETQLRLNPAVYRGSTVPPQVPALGELTLGSLTPGEGQIAAVAKVEAARLPPGDALRLLAYVYQNLEATASPAASAPGGGR